MKKLLTLLLLSPLAFAADKYETVYSIDSYTCPLENLRIEGRRFIYVDKVVDYANCTFGTYNESKNIKNEFPQEYSSLTYCTTKLVIRELDNNKADAEARNGLFLISEKRTRTSKNTPIDFFIRVGEDKLDAESSLYKCVVTK